MSDDNSIIDNLITDLDKLAQSESSCDYGLPIHNESAMHQMRELIKVFIEDFNNLDHGDN